MNNKLKVVSLFSGYGTQELALNYIGVDYENVANCDKFTPANDCYDVLHETTKGNLGDITKVDETTFPDCDLLTYSFPCQDISISGIQKGIKKGTRSGLLFEVERILSVNKPKYLLMENVKNLVSKNHIDNFNNHISYLKELGYGCSWRVLNGADYGCPQNRERVFMMSVFGETSESVNSKMNEVLKLKKQRVSMSSFIENSFSSNLIISADYTKHTPKKKSICRLIATRNDLKYDQAKRIYSVEGCSPCLTTGTPPQIMLNDGTVRYITAREGYRFMGVKESDIDKLLTVNLSNNSHVSLAGNSICVPVMEAIFKVFLNEYIPKQNILSNYVNDSVNV